MSREKNKYINEVGEILNATEMRNYVISEAKRQYEDCNEGEKFDNLSIDIQADIILDQFKWQLETRGWSVITK